MRERGSSLRRLTLAALMAAMTAVATLVIRIPTPSKGYLNLGDCVVNISAWLLGPGYGAAASGIGSALADAVGGYMVYAPASLVIKALMAAVSWFTFTALHRKAGSLPARIGAAVCAELVMMLGYFLFGAAVYGSFVTAAAGLGTDLIQGVLGAAVSVTVYELVVKRAEKRVK